MVEFKTTLSAREAVLISDLLNMASSGWYTEDTYRKDLYESPEEQEKECMKLNKRMVLNLVRKTKKSNSKLEEKPHIKGYTATMYQDRITAPLSDDEKYVFYKGAWRKVRSKDTFDGIMILGRFTPVKTYMPA